MEILTSTMQTLSQATSISLSFLLLYGHQFQCSGIFGSIRAELNSFYGNWEIKRNGGNYGPNMQKVTENLQFKNFGSHEVILSSKDHLKMELYLIEGF